VSATLTLISTVGFILLSRLYNTKNPIDKVWLARVCDPVQKVLGEHYVSLYRQVFYDMVLCLSDQQLVTGIAFLVGALIRMITIYHLNIVTDLAWFSSNTHLLSLQVFRSEEANRRDDGQALATRRKRVIARFPTALRSVLMVTMATVLIYATWITAYWDWDDSDGSCPARCTVGQPRGGGPLLSAILTTLLVVFSYTTLLFDLWQVWTRTWVKKSGQWLLDNTLKPLRSVYRKQLSRSSRRGIYGVYSWTLRPLFLLIWLIFTSEVVDLLQQVAWHVFGYVFLHIHREDGHFTMQLQGLSEEAEAENSLGFGQLVTLLLLILPAVQLFDSFAGMNPMSTSGVAFFTLLTLRVTHSTCEYTPPTESS
jgi:hypothetical protein